MTIYANATDKLRISVTTTWQKIYSSFSINKMIHVKAETLAIFNNSVNT